MGLDILIKLGIALAIGILGGKLAKLVKLPSVSGYLIAGLFVGPAILGNNSILNSNELSTLGFISEIALAFIAFSIGSEFVLGDLKKYGKKVFIITIAEVFGAIILVFCLMFFIFKQDFAFSIVIASMSAATAPAATLLVMRQYRAYGPMTEIFGSIIVGFVIGLILSFVLRKENDHDDLQSISIVAILIGIGVSYLINLSPLLTNIAIGMTLVNTMKRPQKVFNSVNAFVAPFYVLFFTFAGAR